MDVLIVRNAKTRNVNFRINISPRHVKDGCLPTEWAPSFVNFTYSPFPSITVFGFYRRIGGPADFAGIVDDNHPISIGRDV